MVKQVPDALRDDVIKFAQKMSTMMDTKQEEKVGYEKSEYKIEDARIEFGKQAQDLDYLTFPITKEDKEEILKRCIHVANYAMIIYAKIEAGQF